MRNTFIVVMLFALFVVGVCEAETPVPPPQQARGRLRGAKPNIILVLTDDQGMGDLSCMGNKLLKTPHLDSFYEKSTRFTDYHVSPTCAPTRSALMSGRVPFKNGITHTIYQRERMALDVFTVPQALKTAGYKTGIFGKWHLGDGKEYLPGSRGFDEVLIHGAGGIGQVKYGDFPPNAENTYFDSTLLHNDTIVKTKGFCTDLFFHAALAWIKEQNSTDTPYFAYISLNAPHGPFIAPDSYKKRFLKMRCKDRDAGRLGMIENIDDNFGLLWKKLNEWDALDNTLVIFMTDNGAVKLGKTKKIPYFNAGMRGNKNQPYEGGTRVPFFCYWKGKLGEGVDINALTAHIDIYKTFIELAGAQLPKKMQEIDGRSLVPLLEDPKAEWADRELFIHCGRWEPGQREKFKFTKCAVRTPRWRFVNNQELHDISADPGETKNVAKSHPEVAKNLRKAFNEWWESTLPLMVNEGLPKVTEHPLHVRYEQQLKEKGIPDWNPADI